MINSFLRQWMLTTHKVGLLWSWFVEIMTCWMPDFPFCMRLRGWLYGFAMKTRGKDFQVANHVSLKGLENLSVGAHVYFAPGVVILAGLSITIADEVMLAYRVIVTDGNHTMENGSYRFGKTIREPIRIGSGTWIAANSTILAGVTIGRGVLIAANSVVPRQNIPNNVIIGGVPAKILRQL